jgi:hypothetical protein
MQQCSLSSLPPILYLSLMKFAFAFQVWSIPCMRYDSLTSVVIFFCLVDIFILLWFTLLYAILPFVWFNESWFG